VRPVRRGPKRRERGVGQVHQPAVSRSRPRPAPPPRLLAIGPSPEGRSPGTPTQQQQAAATRPSWATPPGASPRSPSLATALGRIEPKPQG